MGKVYLIGAGPGDEELITLKAIRILKKCDVILYDRLANDSILRHVNKDCEIYYCGKRPGSHYKTQEEINDMLVSFAKKGYTVGRIKGGDPYVFGRGGEEALRLHEEGIEFEVIPGITSPISVLNYGGIPTTHRKIAQSFHVYTGKSAEKLNMNWESAAKTEGTLIFLMGLENLPSIVKNLMKYGKDKNTPCGVIMRGTTSKQRKVIGNLENIYEKVKENKLESPCIIVIGEVVDFHEKLAWYENKPLFGMNVCVTRSKEQAGELREKLTDLGAEVTEINTLKVVNTSESLDRYKSKLNEYDYIVLTSVNGVNIFFDRLKDINCDVRNIKGKFAAIGPKTFEAIKERGIIPEIISEKFVAESLFEELKKHVKKEDKILLPRSKNARPYLYEVLTDEGCMVDEVNIYEIVEGTIHDKEIIKDVDIILFTSPSTVKNLISMIGIEDIKDKKVISIGPITRKELDKWNIDSYVSDEYTTEGLVRKLLEIK
ncbi:porphyrin biosynthesis protein HemD [Gottschalkia purinilytica]|uniref:uroporphyrinogen-III C-methyltransferase n=1 Tax=Gottschalkia purinilytica TaxID=1503 RepID=A0A0L0W7S7_GOTPU|nr:uroporphyrinogen-III C-methyltransferase [Gottschalkia purinilytica]KNF07355.1 porphyrin biosynthesis protein HemD [Gottschalkia purinilytica]